MTTARDRLVNLYDRIQKDPAYDHMRDDDINFVPGTGVINPVAMLIGEAPGSMENAMSMPFIGPAGEQLRKILKYVEISVDELYLTNVVKYWPRTTERRVRTPTDQEIEASREYLREEIGIIKPSFIGLCGRIPTKTLFPNIPSLRAVHGRVLDTRYVPLYHPAVLLYKPEKRQEVMSGYYVLASLITTVE